MSKHKIVIFALTLSAFGYASHAQTVKHFWPGNTLSGNECYGGVSGYGPYNYVTQRPKVGIVEAYHFTSEVEQLIRGKSGVGSLEGDIDYTLRAIPNHHRALWAVARHYLRKKKTVPKYDLETDERTKQGLPPPECYFQRAKAFAPDDGLVRMVFGTYLHRTGALDRALAEYLEAEALLPEHAELAYNIGLLYLAKSEIAKAEEYAAKAESLGYPLKGLRRKINRAEQDNNQAGSTARSASN